LRIGHVCLLACAVLIGSSHRHRTTTSGRGDSSSSSSATGGSCLVSVVASQFGTHFVLVLAVPQQHVVHVLTVPLLSVLETPLKVSVDGGEALSILAQQQHQQRLDDGTRRTAQGRSSSSSSRSSRSSSSSRRSRSSRSSRSSSNSNLLVGWLSGVVGLTPTTADWQRAWCLCWRSIRCMATWYSVGQVEENHN
jgi:hypothetical protein